MIYAGAFDCFGYSRAQFAAVYEEVLTRVTAMDKQKSGAQISLFGSIIEEQAIEIRYPNIPEYETMEKLSKEKSVLGVYVSGHPFEKFLPYFKDRTFNCSMLSAYEESEDGVKAYSEISHGKEITMGGMIGAIKKVKTRSGSLMAIVTVEDMFGSIECVCFPKVYDKIRNFLEVDRVVSLTGKISIDEEKAPDIIVEKMWEFTLDDTTATPAKATAIDESITPIASAAQKTEKTKRLWLNVSGMEEADVEELLETLTFYAGDTEVFFVQDGKKMRCSEKVVLNKALMAELSSFLPENCIKVV